jgi:uncharacterized protein (TIGR00255 family)
MTIRSMTGYGAGEQSSSTATFRCEIRCLNSRFVETNLRIPRAFMALEIELQNVVKEKLHRGKIDIMFDVQYRDRTQFLRQIDENAVKHYLDCLNKISSQVGSNSGLKGLPQTLDTTRLLSLEGVLMDATRESSSVDNHKAAIFAALNQAIAAVETMRKTEGTALKSALSDLVSQITTDRKQVQNLLPMLRERLQQNFIKRIQTSLQTLQQSGTTGLPAEERIATEIAFLLDKMDIAEEVTRLEVHEIEFMKAMDAKEPAGRRLDFLCQEMHREVNTMSNKTVQTDAAKFTVNMKQNIERIRQQVQNLE